MLTQTTIPAPLPDEVLVPAVSRARVLVVDDSPSIRAAFTRMLGRAGYLVDTAACISHALGRAVQWQPDVIILDLSLDGEDGRVLLRLLHARLGARMPRVLVCSGAAVALPPRASARLTKPFRVPDALRMVAELARVTSPAGPATEPRPPRRRRLVGAGEQGYGPSSSRPQLVCSSRCATRSRPRS